MDEQPINDSAHAYRMALFATSCNVPPRHAETETRKEPKWTARHDETLAALQKPGAIVCACGHRGTGKTHAAVQIMREYYAANRFPLYRTALEFFFALRSTYGTDRSEEIVMAQHVSPALLVLDEVQVRGDTQFESDRLTYLIDARYKTNRRTLLISNLLPRALAKGSASLEDSLGASIVSRMQETGRVIVFDCDSFRK